MNLEEEKKKIKYSIAYLDMGAKDILFKELSEAYLHGAKILKDYLKYLNLSDTSCTFVKHDP